ncbi:MAG TPA: hypothetical protein VMW34_17480 [Anaerolineales bacterium]|nr:hypothetical protein [Anaerolineales bacterium]
MEVIGWSVIISAIVSTILGAGAGIVTSIVRIRLYEKEREKTERNLITHKLQFETEYQLYLDVWEALKIAAGYVLEIVRKPGDDKPIRLRPIVARDKLRNAHEIIYHKAPFFPPRVYKHVISTVDKIEARFTQRFKFKSGNETWKENQKNYDEMNDCFDALASEIRKRVMGEVESLDPVTPIKILDQIKLDIENQIEK